MFFFFFFSSRRRHTRWTGDWSSDVCSSDLLGPVSGPVVAGLSPACGHSDAGHELSDLAGVAATPEPRKSGSPTRPFFPLGRSAGVVRCPRCLGRERGGCATKQCSGGCPLNGSWNSTHSGSNKVVLGGTRVHATP